MNRLFCSMTLVGAVLTLSFAVAEDKKPPTKKPEAKADQKPDEKIDDKNPSIWMKKKLDYSQNILAGITSEDFD